MTQSKLKSILHYNPETGIFTWNYNGNNQFVKKGNMAGGKNSDGYLSVTLLGDRYRVHRLVFLYVYGKLPAEQVDHINGVREDNRLSNLREVTHVANHKNRKIPKVNTSGVIGVYFHSRHKKWSASIGYKNKRVHLGTFNTKKEAISARKNADIEYGYHENHGR